MKYMVIDVESVGLFGEGFAVGWVVVDESGKRLSEGLAWCGSCCAKCRNIEDRIWVCSNVFIAGPPTHETPWGVRSAFVDAWKKLYNEENGRAAVVADCGWPVEASFLLRCERESSDMPPVYPLHDVASAQLAVGRDPLAEVQRLDDELPRHHPLHDARLSARQWAEATSEFRRVRSEDAALLLQVAEAEFRRVRREDAALLSRAAETTGRYVSEAGGCDHSVGICFCDEIALAAELRLAAEMRALASSPTPPCSSSWRATVRDWYPIHSQCCPEYGSEMRRTRQAHFNALDR